MLNEPKHVAEFLVFSIDYQYMLCLLTDEITVLLLLCSSCSVPLIMMI